MLKFLFFILCFVYAKLEAKIACVQVERAYLYRKPSKKSEVLWVLKKNTPLQVMKEKNSWNYVSDLDGEKSWIQNQFLNKKTKCGIIKSEKGASLFLGPASSGKQSPKRHLRQYTPIEIEKIQETWVKAKNQAYWIKKEDIWPF